MVAEHKLRDRKGKGQSTLHVKGTRKGKTSFRVTVAPGSGIEFVDVGMLLLCCSCAAAAAAVAAAAAATFKHHDGLPCKN